MRKLLWILVLLAFIDARVLATPVKPQPTSDPPQRAIKPLHLTVVGYFLLFHFREPEEILKSSDIDTSNDYMYFTDDNLHYVTIKVFRFGGRDLVALSSSGDAEWDFNVYRYEDGKMRNVTRQVWPANFESYNLICLPHHGTTIGVYDDVNGDNFLCNVFWRNGHFIAQKVKK